MKQSQFIVIYYDILHHCCIKTSKFSPSLFSDQLQFMSTFIYFFFQPCFSFWCRLTNSMLPEEAMHSQYEMKSVAFTNTGDLTPTKGGKLPDARTPPQGFKKTAHDKPSVAKIFTKEKGETRPTTPLSRPEKGADNAETGGKEKSQSLEEIMIYPDGTSKKVAEQKEEEVSDAESLSKLLVVSSKSKKKITSSSLQVPPKKKKGRPRSRSKSPRAPKSPGQGKSPAQTGGSPRGRGRPPKDKSQLKTQDKKKKDATNVPVLSTMEEMFASEVLDLSRKPAPAVAPTPKDSVEKKTGDTDLPLDLSKGKDAGAKSIRGRGRPPLSPEKKRAREMNIDLCIEAVLKRTCEEGEGEEEAMEKEVKAEKISEPADSNQEDTNPAIEDSVDAPQPSVSVKKEMIEDSTPMFELPAEQKKKKKEKTQKQRDEVPRDEVRDKLKDKLKVKDIVGESIKKEPQETEPPNVYDFPESPPKPQEQIKKEVSLSPQKMFSVEFVENREGEKVKEKSKDKERSKVGLNKL